MATTYAFLCTNRSCNSGRTKSSMIWFTTRTTGTASEGSLWNGYGVAGIEFDIQPDVALVQYPVQVDLVDLGTRVRGTLQERASRSSELGDAAGRKHGIEQSHALAVRNRNRSLHSARDAHAREVFVTAQLGDLYRDVGIADELSEPRLDLRCHLLRRQSARFDITDKSGNVIVVRGVAEVTIGDDKKLLHENESTYIPQGAKHRLRNPGKIDLELIEVQTGSYLGEDDIERFDDIYGR